MAVVKAKRCIDCVAEGITTNRKLATTNSGRPVPGPRCFTHHRAKRSTRRNYSHSRHIKETYDISAEEYELIYKAQGGVCYICRRARGIKRKLSVDHCHRTGMVRGLLCRNCNRDVLGHLRDDLDAVMRVVEYLKHPPAVAVIGIRITPDMVGAET